MRMKSELLPEKLKETQILRRLKAHDDSAFVEAYDLYSPKIYRHILFRTSSDDAAADIMSETFLKAWEYLRERASEVTHLRAFIYRIANNLVIDWYRARSRAPDPIDEDMERTLGSDDRIAERTDFILERDRMRRGLELLKKDTRELIVMRFIDELTIEEIAVATGKNKNAVYVAIHRAVKELNIVCATVE